MYHRHAAYLFDLIPDFLVKHYPRPETKCSIRETTAYHEEGHILIVINYDLELERCEINENGRGAKIEIKEPENDIHYLPNIY